MAFSRSLSFRRKTSRRRIEFRARDGAANIVPAKPKPEPAQPRERKSAKSRKAEKPASKPAAKAAPEPAPRKARKPVAPKKKPSPKSEAREEPEPRSEPESVAPRSKKRRKTVEEKTLIGWSEGVAFPEWGIKRIQAKVDTGADSSALHVENLEKIAGGKVRFEVMQNRKPPWRRRHVVAKAVKWARVRSSTGEYTRRCFVRTIARIGPVEKKIDLSLVSREKMSFRMLLGRKALASDFLVDPGKRSHLGSNGAAAKRKKSDEREAEGGEE